MRTLIRTVKSAPGMMIIKEDLRAGCHIQQAQAQVVSNWDWTERFSLTESRMVIVFLRIVDFGGTRDAREWRLLYKLDQRGEAVSRQILHAGTNFRSFSRNVYQDLLRANTTFVTADVAVFLTEL